MGMRTVTTEDMLGDISTHDLEYGGKKYIMEWYHSTGKIFITETCDEPDNEEIEHNHEIYDFERVNN